MRQSGLYPIALAVCAALSALPAERSHSCGDTALVNGADAIIGFEIEG